MDIFIVVNEDFVNVILIVTGSISGYLYHALVYSNAIAGRVGHINEGSQYAINYCYYQQFVKHETRKE